MNNWKEKLTEFYKKINPEKKDFECYQNSDINELREIRNIFNDEASKFQKLIDKRILEQNDALKYKNKCVKFNETILIDVKEIERKNNGFSLLGTVIQIFDDTIDICLSGDIFVYYGHENELKIISEREYKHIVSKHLKNILREANL